MLASLKKMLESALESTQRTGDRQELLKRLWKLKREPEAQEDEESDG